MLFLDFDGVLFDTVREAYAVAMVSTGRVSQISDIDYESWHYKIFKKMRSYVSPAWNYKYLLECLDKYPSDEKSIQENYFRLIAKATTRDYKVFEEAFFNTRTILKSHNYEVWLRLNISFPFLSKIKPYLHDFEEYIFIVTTKDKATVLKLLDIENILFDENKIFDKNDYAHLGNKKNIIENIMPSTIDKAVFIDDSDKHIFDCSGIQNLICLQPSWGYISLESKTSTQSVIIEQINQLFKGQTNVRN